MSLLKPKTKFIIFNVYSTHVLQFQEVSKYYKIKITKQKILTVVCT